MQIIFKTLKKSYALQSDGASFEIAELVSIPELDKETKKPTGNMVDVWRAFKWHGSLSAALESVAMLKVKHSDVSTLAELRTMLTKLHKDLIKEYKL